LSTNYYALEYLETGLATLNNADMDFELIASAELWNIRAK
jgi:hypothetical protein